MAEGVAGAKAFSKTAGAGLAWTASAVGPETRLGSVEVNAARASACQPLFADLRNVTVLHGD